LLVQPSYSAESVGEVAFDRDCVPPLGVASALDDNFGSGLGLRRRADHCSPGVGLVERVKCENLDPTTGRLLVSIEAGGEHPGVVRDDKVSRTEEVREFTERVVLERSSLSGDNKQTTRIATIGWNLSNRFWKKVERVGGNLIVLLGRERVHLWITGRGNRGSTRVLSMKHSDD